MFLAFFVKLLKTISQKEKLWLNEYAYYAVKLFTAMLAQDFFFVQNATENSTCLEKGVCHYRNLKTISIQLLMK